MLYCLELVVVELVIRSNVDVCALIVGAIAVIWCRKDYGKDVSNFDQAQKGERAYLLYTSCHVPPSNPPSEPRDYE